MSKTQQDQVLRDLFATAVNSPFPDAPALDSPHPIDDEDLLLDWSLGDLSPERHQQVLDHLAACPACRREIAAMVRAGVLSLPTVDASVPDAIPRAEPTTSAWRRPAIVTLVVALAASVLLVLAPTVFDFGAPEAGSLIAMAQRDLDQGRPDEAFARLETYLSSGGPAEDQRGRAAALLESAGYELARGGLSQGDFRRVAEIDSRVTSRTRASARLLNLRLQAERGETAERSLAQRRSLVRDYGYERNGQRLLKDFSIPEITPTQRRIEAELLAGIEAFPDSLDLRLNYGQFLLDQNEFQRAEAVFAEAVRREPRSVLAQTGLGLALFQQNRPEAIERALEPFQRAVQLSPDDPTANLNLAVCLTRLGRAQEAQPSFNPIFRTPF